MDNKLDALGSAEGKKGRTRRPLVLAAVMLAMFMGAIEATIVSTAMPSIVGDLGGFTLYSWVFSAYLLMNAVTVLIYGKLSDLFGRKPVIIFGISVFLIGSLLCGFAPSMEWLIIFRFIQGFGAGAVSPVATTIIGDIYTREERAKVQGYLSSVWGISAISGPAIGGILVEYVSWRYVFWLNIPLGILAIAGIWIFLHENRSKKKHEIDFKGALLLTVSISSFLFLLVEGGLGFSWLSAEALILMLVSLTAFYFFVRNEKVAKEPMISFSLWKQRPIFIANATSMVTGAMLIGISSFLPAFVQGVMEQPPIIAGFTLTAVSIGWPIASALSGWLLIKIGYRRTSLFGACGLIIGAGMFAAMTPAAGPLWAAAASFVFGTGMGLTSTAFIVSIQSTVSWEQRGAATAGNMFMRNLGNTVGAAVLGGIMNLSIQNHLNESQNDSLTLDSINALLTETERKLLSPETLTILQEGLTSALHSVYLALLALAFLSLLLIAFLPKKGSQGGEG